MKYRKYPVAIFEDFTALKSSNLDSFRALTPMARLEDFGVLKSSKLEEFEALKSSKLEDFWALKPYGKIGGF